MARGGRGSRACLCCRLTGSGGEASHGSVPTCPPGHRSVDTPGLTRTHRDPPGPTGTHRDHIQIFLIFEGPRAAALFSSSLLFLLQREETRRLSGRYPPLLLLFFSFSGANQSAAVTCAALPARPGERREVRAPAPGVGWREREPRGGGGAVMFFADGSGRRGAGRPGRRRSVPASCAAAPRSHIQSLAED